jgi:hypothetical protein
MIISHKLMTLGLAIGLLGTRARSQGLSHEKRRLRMFRQRTSGATGDAHRPSANADKDGRPR